MSASVLTPVQLVTLGEMDFVGVVGFVVEKMKTCEMDWKGVVGSILENIGGGGSVCQIVPDSEEDEDKQAAKKLPQTQSHSQSQIDLSQFSAVGCMHATGNTVINMGNSSNRNDPPSLGCVHLTTGGTINMNNSNRNKNVAAAAITGTTTINVASNGSGNPALGAVHAHDATINM
jgi:hypothetical protein